MQDYEQQISAPAWINTERYDVVAKIPPGTTREQFRQMLQNLLAERFKLVVHHETKQLPVYDLVLDEKGPKIRESSEVPNAVEPPPGTRPRERDSRGFPVVPAGMTGLFETFGPGPRAHWTSRGTSIAELARSLNQPLAAGRIVFDKTGLTGKYDYTLEYDQQSAGGSPPTPSGVVDNVPGPTLFEAVRKQLGLRLVDTKAAFDVVVVDHAEKVPIDN